MIISAAIRFVGIISYSFVKEPVIGGTILRPIKKAFPFTIRSNTERNINVVFSAGSTDDVPDDVILEKQPNVK